MSIRMGTRALSGDMPASVILCLTRVYLELSDNYTGYAHIKFIDVSLLYHIYPSCPYLEI